MRELIGNIGEPTVDRLFPDGINPSKRGPETHP